jgi:hypothetical protein
MRRMDISIYLIHLASLGPRIYLASKEMSTKSRNMFLGSRERPVRRDENLTATCEPIV